MTLGDFQTLLLEETGRHDLYHSDGSNLGGAVANKGANRIINEAHSLLELRVSHLKTPLWFMVDIYANSFFAELRYLKTIDKIYIINSSGARKQLVKRDYNWMLNEFLPIPSKVYYSDSAPSSTTAGDIWIDTDDSNATYVYSGGWVSTSYALTDAGTPLYYAEIPLALTPEQDTLTLNTFSATFGRNLIRYSNPHEYKRIIIAPPADATFTLQVIGKFKWREVAAITDDSYWLVQYPYLLLDACRAVMEKGLRNFTGVRDWRGEIDETLKGIDNDFIDQEIGDDDHVMSG